MAQNLAQKYEKKVDERFKRKSFTEAGINRDYEWTGVDSINVYQVDVVANNDYTRSGTARYGSVAELGTQLQNMALSKDRSFTFSIDRGNHTEEMMVTQAGKSLARQIDEVEVPEVDTYRLGVMSAAAIANGHTATAAVTASNAYEVLLDGQTALTDDLVPMEGRIAFVSPAYYKFLKLDNSFIKASDMGQKMLVKGQVGEVDGVKIIVSPTSYLPANTAYILTHPVATVAADKLNDYKIHDNPPGINGWLVEGRIIYDAFVLDGKVNAIYTHLIA